MENAIYFVTAAIAFAVTGLLGFILIPWLKKLKFGQTILDIGPSWHKSKQGTPTMGGLIFILGIAVAIAATFAIDAIRGSNTGIFADITKATWQNRFISAKVGISGLLMAVSFGFVGFIDDYIKVVKKRNLGLTPRQKTFLQLLIASAFLGSTAWSGLTYTWIPFAGNVDVSQGIGLIYWPIALAFIYGFVNAVNLTDGIDGLCSGVTVAVSVFYMMLSGILDYGVLNMLAGATAGGCSGFLLWNMKPAKVFMGDTGSLFLGGMVVAMAFASGMPVLLVFVGFIYLAEALSVLIQVSHYKRTKKRIFKMAPIHHHFEMSGWTENKIVIVFTSLTVVGCIIAALFYASAKIM